MVSKTKSMQWILAMCCEVNLSVKSKVFLSFKLKSISLLKALNCNPTLKYIEKLGGTKKRGEKIIPIEEFLQIFSEVKKEKEQGCYEDFIECLKLYDKREDGKMVLAELSYALLALGKCVINITEIIRRINEFHHLY